MTRKPTEIRQAEIKKSVLEIIKNEGIKALSTKNLARQTGISEGAIFRHFKSKRDIILSIINDVSTDLIEELRKIAYDEKKKPEKRLFNYLCKTITYLTENNGITILLFTEASHTNDEEMMTRLNTIFNSQRQLAGKIISDGMAQGVWNKNIAVEDVTMLYMGIPITHNINLILSKGKAYKRDFCNKMMLLFERILIK
jgi:AcrR family transcriptional regulator